MAHSEQDYVDGWQTFSRWFETIRRRTPSIIKLDEDRSFKKKLVSFSSLYDEFKYVWSNEQLREELRRIFKRHIEKCQWKHNMRPSKSSSESKRMRDLGNESFKNGNFIAALNYYSQAVKLAPYPGIDGGDDTLAIALANRSAASFALTRYRLCLLDIDLAIRYGYPEASKFKLLIRRVKALHILSVWANDVEQIKSDLKTMAKNPSTKEYVRQEINNMFEFLERTQPETMEKDEIDVFDETVMRISNTSKTLPQAADCCEMSYDSTKGRYLLTNKDVSFGRLLVAEEPFACNLAPSKRDLYCYNCFGNLHSCGLACKNCTQVLYCSVECLEARSELHSYECNKFLNLQEHLGVAYLVAHIMFKIQFDPTTIPMRTKKVTEMKSLEEVLKMPPSEWPDYVYKNDYASVISLLHHANDYKYDQHLVWTVTALYLLTAFIDQYSSVNHKLAEEEFQIIIGSVILRHLMQLQTNIISILDQDLQSMANEEVSPTDIKESPVGIGIYPTISLLNHSCCPNIIAIFNKNRFVVRAAKSLECGTEINYCYGPSINRMSKKDRQQKLSEQYFFNCVCDYCANNKENEGRALVCPKCSGPLIYNNDLTNQCLNCKRKNLVKVDEYLKQIKALEVEFENSCISGEDDSKRLQDLQSVEERLSKLAYWRNPIFVKIKGQLVECAENQEKLEVALKYCQEELNLSDKTFGEGSLESIMTKLKYVNLDWQHLYYTIENDKSPENIEKLKCLLVTINQTKGKLKELLASTSIIGAESTFDGELKFLGGVQSSINKYLSGLEPVIRNGTSH